LVGAVRAESDIPVAQAVVRGHRDAAVHTRTVGVAMGVAKGVVVAGVQVGESWRGEVAEGFFHAGRYTIVRVLLCQR